MLWILAWPCLPQCQQLLELRAGMSPPRAVLLGGQWVATLWDAKILRASLGRGELRCFSSPSFLSQGWAPGSCFKKHFWAAELAHLAELSLCPTPVSDLRLCGCYGYNWSGAFLVTHILTDNPRLPLPKAIKEQSAGFGC